MQQLLLLRPALRPGFQAGVLALGLAGAVPALAADRSAMPPWSFSGFGTLGVVHSSGHEADFTTSTIKASGAGYSDRWSADVDSRLGAQLDLAPGQRWSAVLQVVSEQQSENSYRPVIEWANVKWQVRPDLAIRAGRIALPMYLAADYRKIGYIYPWVRPPAEVYGVVPVSSSDGIDMTWGWEALGIRHSTQAYYGHRNLRLTDTVRVRARQIAGISNTMQYGAASARITMMSAQVTFDGGPALLDALAAVGAPGLALAGQYSVEHRRATSVGFGVDYDPGDWFLSAEANHIRTRSFLGNTSAAYASAGYRWGTLTPWVGHARIRVDSRTLDPGLLLAGQSTVSTGVRWDFRRDFALKLEYQRLTARNGSRGTVVNVQHGFRSDGPVEVASMALDFVF